MQAGIWKAISHPLNKGKLNEGVEEVFVVERTYK